MSGINKIHSTTMSLNDRFTAIASKPAPLPVVRRSRSRSIPRPVAPKEQFASLANRRLLQQLVRKDKMRAALKLKRRSMRTVGAINTRANLRVNNGLALSRGSVKALRVAANGRPFTTNSLSKVATMKADLVAMRNRRPLRRSNSIASLSGRVGRPAVGGAAQRVAARRMERVRGRSIEQIGGSARRGRSRSRSRARLSSNDFVAQQRFANNGRARSQSRSRAIAGAGAATMRRGRSRSRSRARAAPAARRVPIKARLGVRPGNTAVNANRRGVPNRRQSVTRGVAQGRIQKRRNSTAAVARAQPVNGAGGGRVGRIRGRSAVRGGRGRSQSRNGGNRRVSGGQQQLQQQGTFRGTSRRGRNQQRGGATQKNGKPKTNNQQQEPARRGRSRSRGRGGRGNLGKNSRKPANKDDLDKELDSYMATTKTENNMDYLLKN